MPSLNTPAKINLFLNLIGPRPDGFHEVCFVMQTIALFDTLTMEPTPGQPLRFTCSQPELTEHPEDNLVVKAYYLFYKALNQPPDGMALHLKKIIPVQAGLGGGSSNAAGMLMLLNQWHENPLPLVTLTQLAAQLGSDVPFFLHCGTALATGRGEIITPLDSQLPPLSLVVIKPTDFGIATPAAYQTVRQANRYTTVPVGPLLQSLSESATEASLSQYLYNDFETALFPHFPALTAMADAMKAAGVRRPLLSGSGPAMVGLLDRTPETQQAIAHHFPPERFHVFWTRLLPPDLPKDAAGGASLV
jgi:4-diphosphocytidyl-2-C-methyl-D-erythritol kinase